LEQAFVVSGQKLGAIPPQVELGAQRLTVLSLEHNAIRQFSSRLAKLTSLTVLNLCHNQLTHIGNELASLRELTVLRLEGNLIASTPLSPFLPLSHLQTLDLSANQLTEFPDCVSVLPGLQRLSLARNMISVLPAALAGRMERLHVLDMSNNRLQSLPPEMSLMTALRVLHLHCNALEMLPATLGRIEWDSFRVEDNPLSCIPASTVAKGSRAVLFYLKDLLSGADYFYRVKLLVTGQANVGKSTLLSALKVSAYCSLLLLVLFCCIGKARGRPLGTQFVLFRCCSSCCFVCVCMCVCVCVCACVWPRAGRGGAWLALSSLFSSFHLKCAGKSRTK
jgi:hypothetical protein